MNLSLETGYLKLIVLVKLPLSGKLTNLFEFDVSTTFQLAATSLPLPSCLNCVNLTSASIFLKNPFKVYGMPFMAYNQTSVVPSFTLILCVGV